ncbi:hypothetical protein DFH27DRAFT_196314 [Peziza echinospora]|nr:hypothetical protein DFH27DRAFT_196314 [Peziza echinospora]
MGFCCFSFIGSRRIQFRRLGHLYIIIAIVFFFFFCLCVFVCVIACNCLIKLYRSFFYRFFLIDCFFDCMQYVCNLDLLGYTYYKSLLYIFF